MQCTRCTCRCLRNTSLSFLSRVTSVYAGGAETELNIEPHRHLVGIPNEMLRENGKFENYYYWVPRISKQHNFTKKEFASIRQFTTLHCRNIRTVVYLQHGGGTISDGTSSLLPPCIIFIRSRTVSSIQHQVVPFTWNNVPHQIRSAKPFRVSGAIPKISFSS